MKVKVFPAFANRYASEITILKQVGVCKGAPLSTGKYKEEKVWLVECRTKRERIRKDEKGGNKTIDIDRTVQYHIRDDLLRRRYNCSSL